MVMSTLIEKCDSSDIGSGRPIIIKQEPVDTQFLETRENDRQATSVPTDNTDPRLNSELFRHKNQFKTKQLNPTMINKLSNNQQDEPVVVKQEPLDTYEENDISKEENILSRVESEAVNRSVVRMADSRGGKVNKEHTMWGSIKEEPCEVTENLFMKIKTEEPWEVLKKESGNISTWPYGKASASSGPVEKIRFRELKVVLKDCMAKKKRDSNSIYGRRNSKFELKKLMVVLRRCDVLKGASVCSNTFGINNRDLDLKNNQIKTVEPNLETKKTKEDPYICKYCSKVYKVYFRLVDHERLHEAPLYQCDLCEKSCTNYNSLSTHRRTHTGESFFKSSQSKKSFGNNSTLIKDLNTQQRNSDDERVVTVQGSVHPVQNGDDVEGHDNNKCVDCDKRFNSKLSLLNHRFVHLKKLFQCKSCDKTFHRESWLLAHRRVHTGEKPYVCSVCQQRFTFKSKLVCHKLKCVSKNRTETPESPRVKQTSESPRVKQTPESPRVKQTLESPPIKQTSETQRVKRTSETPRVKRTSESPRVKRTPESPRVKRTPESPRVKQTLESPPIKQTSETQRVKRTSETPRVKRTSESPRVKQTSKTLRVKLTSKSPGIKRIHTCENCERKCVSKSQLTIHLRIHTGEKPFQCNVCDRAFTQKGNLRKHLFNHTKTPSKPTNFGIHTGEKPFKCNICDRAFTQKGNLRKHLFNHTKTPSKPTNFGIHTGEKPFKCNICDRAFTQKGHLRTHLFNHTKNPSKPTEKPFQCNLCDKAFTMKKNLRRHSFIHAKDATSHSHNAKPF